MVYFTEILLHSDSFYEHGLTLIPTWMSNQLPNDVRDEITHPFPNFNGARHFIYNGCNYLSMLDVIEGFILPACLLGWTIVRVSLKVCPMTTHFSFRIEAVTCCTYHSIWDGQGTGCRQGLEPSGPLVRLQFEMAHSLVHYWSLLLRLRCTSYIGDCIRRWVKFRG